MPTITVFTPTYNRANTLKRTFQSLCRQTCRDFEWLIVDDGSTDETKQLVQTWQSSSDFKIRYLYKENGGLHTGYNVAIQNIESELCICCDSDDFMPDDAIEFITKTWRELGTEDLAGIIGLDFDAANNLPIGGFFPKVTKTYHFLDIQPKLHHHGDTKMVLRTALLKPYVPMPSFPGEKNFNPIYLYFLINPRYEYIIVNKNLCNVDYQPTGMSANILRQFRNSPRSFAELRKVKLMHPRVSLQRKFVDAIHLVSSALFAKDFNIILSSPKKWLLFFASPLGVGLYFYVRKKTS